MRSANLAYLPRLDHLRFAAAFLVLAFHLYHYFFHGWQPNPDAAGIGFIVEGHSGVALFFSLSGFLFMLIALQGPIRYRQFLTNRVLRIVPLFLVIFYLAITLGRDEFQASDIFYLLFSNIGSPPTSDHFVTGAAWTISVEFTFYLIFPFMAAAFMAQGWRYMIGVWLLLLLFKLLIYTSVTNPMHVFYSTLPGRLDQFLIGMAAAVLYARHRETLARHGIPLFVVALSYCYTMLFLLAKYASTFSENRHEPLWIVWSSIESFGWALLILGYLSLPAVRGRIAERTGAVFVHCGKISYSFYLLHASVLYLWLEYLGVWQPTAWFAVNFLANLLVVLVLCIALASLSYACIERPFLAQRRRYISPSPNASQTEEKDV